MINSKMRVYEKTLTAYQLTDNLKQIGDIRENAIWKLNNAASEEEMRLNSVQYLSLMDGVYFKTVMGYWKQIYLNDLTKHGLEHDFGLEKIHNLAVERIETVKSSVMLGNDLTYDNDAIQSLAEGYFIELWKYRMEVRLICL